MYVIKKHQKFSLLNMSTVCNKKNQCCGKFICALGLSMKLCDELLLSLCSSGPSRNISTTMKLFNR